MFRHSDQSGYPDADISATVNCFVRHLWVSLLLDCLRNSEGEEMGVRRRIGSLHHFLGFGRATDSFSTLGANVRSGVLCISGLHHGKHDCDIRSSIQLLLAKSSEDSQIELGK